MSDLREYKFTTIDVVVSIKYDNFHLYLGYCLDCFAS